MPKLVVMILPLEPILQLQWQVLLLVRRRHRRGSCFATALLIPNKISLTTLNVSLLRKNHSDVGYPKIPSLPVL